MPVLDDLTPYLANEELIVQSREEEAERRLALLNARAQIIKNRLVELGATRVWLFGSLARGHVHRLSDVDIAVEGLTLAQDQLLAAAEDNAYIPADIVPMEHARPALREHIWHEGILLYDAAAREDC